MNLFYHTKKNDSL